MNNEILSRVGTVELQNVRVADGQIEVHFPLCQIAKEIEVIIDACIEKYIEEYNVAPDVVNYDFRIVFSFGCLNPEFSASVIVWQAGDDDKARFYDGFEINLTSSEKKRLKRLVWDKLGDALFS